MFVYVLSWVGPSMQASTRIVSVFRLQTYNLVRLELEKPRRTDRERVCERMYYGDDFDDCESALKRF